MSFVLARGKRFFGACVLAACFMVFSVAGGGAAWGVNGFSGEGAGTAASPYEITDWHELNEVRDYLSSHFRLMNNLDKNSAGYNDYNDGVGWEPIGTSAFPFTGTFNGGGNTITDLFIDRPGANHVGLFGATGSYAGISNLGLVDVDVTGGSHVAGLVGLSWATIGNSYVTGEVDGGSYVGGLAGGNAGQITNSYATGRVTGTSSLVGGLAGYSIGVIDSSHSGGMSTGHSVAVGCLDRTKGLSTIHMQEELLPGKMTMSAGWWD